jgi:hypothetical protein
MPKDHTLLTQEFFLLRFRDKLAMYGMDVAVAHKKVITISDKTKKARTLRGVPAYWGESKNSRGVRS